MSFTNFVVCDNLIPVLKISWAGRVCGKSGKDYGGRQCNICEPRRPPALRVRKHLYLMHNVRLNKRIQIFVISGDATKKHLAHLLRLANVCAYIFFHLSFASHVSFHLPSLSAPTSDDGEWISRLTPATAKRGWHPPSLSCPSSSSVPSLPSPWFPNTR